MSDLTNPKWIYFKGLLFLAAGLVAAFLLIAEARTARTIILLVVCVWSFCRAYYFAFYVIEKYVDGEFRFAGLIDFVRYLRGGRSQ